MDADRVTAPGEVFSIVADTLSPIKTEDESISFSFKLGPNEFIHDIFLRSPVQHRNGHLYGDDQLLANYPGELNYALALYSMPGHRFDLYEKMIGSQFCSKCLCDMTEEKIFYLPFSTDPFFRIMIEVWSRKYQEFRVDFIFDSPPPPSSVKLYVKKVIKYQEMPISGGLIKKPEIGADESIKEPTKEAKYTLTEKGCDKLKDAGFPLPKFIIGMYLDQWQRWDRAGCKEAFLKVENTEDECMFHLLVRCTIDPSYNTKKYFLMKSEAFSSPEAYYDNIDTIIQDALKQGFIRLAEKVDKTDLVDVKQSSSGDDRLATELSQIAF